MLGLIACNNTITVISMTSYDTFYKWLIKICNSAISYSLYASVHVGYTARTARVQCTVILDQVLSLSSLLTCQWNKATLIVPELPQN